MDRKNRPVGREKHVTGGSGNVHKRGEGLHTGPVGNQSGYSGRGKQSSGDKGLIDDALGGLGGLSGLGSGSSSAGNALEDMVINEVAQEITGKKKGKPLLIVLGIALVLFLLFGGTSILPSLLSSATGISSSHDLLNSYSGSTDDWSSYTGGSYGTSGGSSQSGGTGGVLNTSVDSQAREKRTVIQGGGQDTITIMVYMCGTDLESRAGMATSDLQEMAAATLSDKINLIVYTGGCQQWQNQVISNQTNQIYQVENGGLKPLVQDVGSKAMTDSDTLSEYIRWGKENFPADRYDLILWDHGGGSTSGYGYDQLYANSGSMTLDKISTALKDGGCTFDFIGFDACLMATLENALVVEPYADYLIASEETEPGVGWYYTNWLTKLSENTSMSTLEIGKNIVDDFVSVCGQKTPSDQTTLSVIDLAELQGTVPEKFKEFAKATTKLIQNNEYQQVSNARSATKEFAKSSGIDQVDLIHLANNLGTTESEELAKVLQSAVKYNLTSGNVSNAYGISIYFPYGQVSAVNKMVNTYDRIGLDDDYTECIKSFASLETGGQVVAGGSSGQLQSLFGSLLSGGSSYSSGSGTSSSAAIEELLGSLLTGRSMPQVGLDEESAGFVDQATVEGSTQYLTENQFDTSNLIWQEKDGQSVLALNEKQWDLIQTVELNVFVDDGSGYIDLGLDNVYSFDEAGDLIGDYDQTWMAINDQIVAYYMLSAEGTSEDYKITGKVPAMLNDERVDLILIFTDENPYGQVAGARLTYAGGETDTEAKGLIELQQGDTIDFLCDYYDYDQNFVDDYYLGERMYVEDTLEVSNITMTNTEYLAAYRLTDIYNNHYWTPTI